MQQSIEINTLTGGISTKEKILALYTTASPEEPPSMKTELRVLVQPTSPIRLWCEESPKFYVFSAQKILSTFCVPFPNCISHFKILAMS